MRRPTGLHPADACSHNAGRRYTVALCSPWRSRPRACVVAVHGRPVGRDGLVYLPLASLLGLPLPLADGPASKCAEPSWQGCVLSQE